MRARRIGLGREPAYAARSRFCSGTQFQGGSSSSIEPALRRLRDAAEHIGEPGLRIDVVELGGADQRVHRRGPHAAAVRAGEQPTASSEGNPPKRPVSGVIPETDAAVVDEAGEHLPAPEHVVQAFATKE